MLIEEILTPESIKTNLESADKISVIKELAGVLGAAYPEMKKDLVVKRVLERERVGSTGLGDGVAIPHCKIPGLEFLMCCFGRSVQGIDFQSADNQPAQLFFLIVAPENAASVHLKALARISRMCHKEEFRRAVLAAGTSQDVWDLMKKED